MLLGGVEVIQETQHSMELDLRIMSLKSMAGEKICPWVIDVNLFLLTAQQNIDLEPQIKLLKIKFYDFNTWIYELRFICLMPTNIPINYFLCYICGVNSFVVENQPALDLNPFSSFLTDLSRYIFFWSYYPQSMLTCLICCCQPGQLSIASSLSFGHMIQTHIWWAHFI